MKKEKNEMSEKFRELSDEELKAVAGGTYIGDIYGDCEDYEDQCKSLLIGGGIDICSSIFQCDDDHEEDDDE